MSEQEVVSDKGDRGIYSLLKRAAATTPERIALKQKESSLNYYHLRNEVDQLSSKIDQLELPADSRIAIDLPKGIGTVIAIFAVARSDHIFVPINPQLKPSQLQHILNDSGACLLITTPQRADHLSSPSSSSPLTILICRGYDTLSPQWKERASARLREGDPSQNSALSQYSTPPTALLYTSGSSGLPKGVVLSAQNMLLGAESVASYLQLQKEDRILALLPLSFDYGLNQILSAFFVGATVILYDFILPGPLLKTISKEQISGLAAIPTLWNQLAHYGGSWPEGVSRHLRFITNSGGSMPPETLKHLQQQLPETEFYLMYGLTEAFRSTTLLPNEIDTHPNSIGKAIPNAEVAVVRPDGTPCDANEIGELVHRGPLVAQGYWNRSVAENRQRFRESPQHPGELEVWSGDEVYRDSKGYLYFVGRRDMQIKSSGYRISPNEIEQILHASDLLLELIAFGVPHPVLGEAIVVNYSAADPDRVDTETALIEYSHQHLPNYMQPQRWIASRTLPLNANGKVDREGIQREYQQLFNKGDRK